ncbi:MAG: hypothetical protein ABR950_08540 [Candidatus Dormibacteria bacterium]|jgi:hypothetical protein
MPLFGRLFGSRPPSSPPPNTAVIADDLVVALAAGGTSLDAAVDAALRRHLEAERRAAEAEKRGEKIPFWLRREGGGSGEMEDALRDRIAQRRAGEDDR